jgi:hypothetical protein
MATSAAKWVRAATGAVGLVGWIGLVGLAYEGKKGFEFSEKNFSSTRDSTENRDKYLKA